MEPEAKARLEIDQMLIKSGWTIQDADKISLSPEIGIGIAVREYQTSNGPADYVLFVDESPVGVIEAKETRESLVEVTEQSEKYLLGLKKIFPDSTPCFSYETTGVKTQFADRRDPDYRSREVFSFHRPEFLQELLKSEKTLRQHLNEMPELDSSNLRDCQTEAIIGLENSFSKNRERSLIHMSTGSGKTVAAVSSVYRLLKFAKAKRVLFLVDRNNLGLQALKAFQSYTTPDTGQKFKELYEIQHLQSNTIEDVDVVITTIQRMYSILKGEKEFDSELEEKSQFESNSDDDLVEIKYNEKFPIESFDFIIIDECHRSIYNKWRDVLLYFDAFLIGLTATPTIDTQSFFKYNMVSRYPRERAIVDGVNVDSKIFKIRTSMGENATVIEKGQQILKRNKQDRKDTAEIVDDEITYGPKNLGRDVISPHNIKIIMGAFKDGLEEMFPNRTKWVPKTLVFAKTDEHAEEITKIIREVFDKGNEFCKKITYKSEGKKEELISDFQIDPQLRIAVTVDMIATGTDIQALECIIFMRDIKSQVYFEQMRGRGSRIIDDGDLMGITPDAGSKDLFWIVDPVGVCESAKSDKSSLDKKPSETLEKLIKKASERRANEDDLETIVSRLTRLNSKINEKDKQKILDVTEGKTIPQISNKILDQLDTVKQIEETKKQFNTEEPTQEQIKEISKKMIKKACQLFDSPEFREIITNIQKQQHVLLDITNQDKLLQTGISKEQKLQSIRDSVASFEEFIEENKDKIDALSIIYSESSKMNEITFKHIAELAEKIQQPPCNMTPSKLWDAYATLNESKTKNNPVRTLTDLISIIRFSTGSQDMLVSFTELVDEKFEKWISNQKSSGISYTTEQMEWLVMIKEQIGISAEMKIENMDYAPFNQKGGAGKYYQIFGENYENILKEMHEVLVSV